MVACRSNYWDEEFANSVNFTGDPIIPTPDVVETAVLPDDEFVILATDGLWYVPRQSALKNFVHSTCFDQNLVRLSRGRDGTVEPYNAVGR